MYLLFLFTFIIDVIHLLVIWMSSLDTCLLSVFVYFKVNMLAFHHWVGFSSLSCMSSLYISHINTHQKHALWIFLLFYELSFCFLLCCVEIYNLIYFPTTYFWCLCFGSLLWEVNTKANFEKIFLPMFSSRIVTALGLLYIFELIFVYFLCGHIFLYYFLETLSQLYDSDILLTYWLVMYEVTSGFSILFHCLYIWLYVTHCLK